MGWEERYKLLKNDNNGEKIKIRFNLGNDSYVIDVIKRVFLQNECDVVSCYRSRRNRTTLKTLDWLDDAKQFIESRLGFLENVFYYGEKNRFKDNTLNKFRDSFYKETEFADFRVFFVDDKRKNIRGIMLDLEKDPNFSTGSDFKFPECIDYLDQTDQFDPIYRDASIKSFYNMRYRDLKNELTKFVYDNLAKSSNGFSERPIGFYIIIDNKIYYFTMEEYNNIINSSGKFSHITDDHLLGSPSETYYYFLDNGAYFQILNTIKDNSTLLDEKPFIDISNIEKSKWGFDEFFNGMLTGDKEVYAFLDSRLKNQDTKLGGNASFKKSSRTKDSSNSYPSYIGKCSSDYANRNPGVYQKRMTLYGKGHHI